VLNFIAIDLQLYKIFNITRFQFFWDSVHISHYHEDEYKFLFLKTRHCFTVYYLLTQGISFIYYSVTGRICCNVHAA